MRKTVNIEKLITTFEDMANRESLLCRDGVTQKDLLQQIIGTIVHTVMEEEKTDFLPYKVHGLNIPVFCFIAWNTNKNMKWEIDGIIYKDIDEIPNDVYKKCVFDWCVNQLEGIIMIFTEPHDLEILK